MYSEKKNILELVALLKAHGIEDCVLCPGSRNAPIILSLSNDKDFKCYSITDERSAGFFALGIALNTAKTVAVVCTSGSALLNLAPSVAEAYYQGVSLLIISADRPQAWIGQMDGQTIPQPNVFGSLVKQAVNLPEVKTDEDLWYCNRLINEAILSTSHHSRGPAHINVPISEALFDVKIESLPQARKIERIKSISLYESQSKDLINRLKSFQKRMILVGQMNLFYIFAKQDSKKLYKQFVWLGEHTSNQTIPGVPIENFDLVLRSVNDELLQELRPELLITYGGHTISKSVKQYLRKYKPTEHWHICPKGEVIDLFASLTTVIEMDPFEFLEKIANAFGNQIPQYPKRWEHISSLIPKPNFPYSAMKAIELLTNALPQETSLHLANSSAVRYAQLYPIDSSIEVCSNRGVNGIEGSLSTAVGYALSSSKLIFLVIGDLSFFYDNNALWNKYLSPNLRILLLNNQGGEIFYNLKGLEQSPNMKQFISAEHKTTAKAWTEDRGLIYQAVHNEDELKEGIDFLTAPDSNFPRIIEVFTDKEEDIKLLNKYYNSIKI